MARYADSRTYLVCTFGEGRVKIEQFIDGKPVKLADEATETPLPATGATAGMRVDGTNVQCLIGSEPAASATVAESTGGIGVRVWDAELNNAEVLVRSVRVTPIE